jgi:hypothetical protein
MITTLCTREIGRELVNELIDGKEKIIFFLREDDDKGACFNHSCHPNFHAIFINPNQLIKLPTYQGLSDEKMEFRDKFEYTPPFIILGHEMVHALNYTKDSVKFQERLDVEPEVPELDNLEEQLTILGWGDKDYKPKPIDRWQQDEITRSEGNEIIANMNFEDWDKSLEVKQSEAKADSYFLWQKESENGLRSVFGISPRTADHRNGEVITKTENTDEMEFFSRIKVQNNMYNITWSEFFTPSFVEFMTWRFGWQEFLDLAMEKACEAECWDLTILLKEKGASEISREIWGNKLDRGLIYAIVNEDNEKISHLLGLGADASFQNMNTTDLAIQLKKVFFDELANKSYAEFNLEKRLGFRFKITLESIQNWNEFLNEAADIVCRLNKWKAASQFVSLGVEKNALRKRWQKILDEDVLVQAENKQTSVVYDLGELGADLTPLLNLDDERLSELGLNRSLLEFYKNKS